MKTDIAEQLGIEFPIFAFTHCRDVVAAVTKAGGIGILGAAGHTPERLAIDLAWIEEQVGDRPYGIDTLIPARAVRTEAGTSFDEAELAAMIPSGHRTFLDDMMRRYEVPTLPEGATTGEGMMGGGQMRIGDEALSGIIDVALAHNPRVFASALGSPPGWLVERAHAKGMLVGALAGAPRHAEKHKAAGCDFVIAQGTEAGGHTGDISTMVLVPQVVDAVAPLPVLAAGGIGSGRQMAAALALGASGVWTGSIWLTTEEAEETPEMKAKLLAAGSSDTVRSRCMSGKPVRQIKTAWTEEWENPANPDPLEMPLQGMLTGPYMARIQRASHNERSGAYELLPAIGGQIVGMMTQVKPARQVVFDIVEELITANERLEHILGD